MQGQFSRYHAVAFLRDTDDNAPMQMDDRIRQMLKRHLQESEGLNVNKWALKAKISESGLRNFLTGENRSITIERLEKLANAEKISLSTVFSSTIPVVGKVGAGAEMHPFDDYAMGTGMDYVEAPAGCPLDAVAVVIDGDSMFPDYWPGDILIYRRQDAIDRANFLYQDCIVKVTDGPTLVKRVKPGSSPNFFTLESTNAPPRVNVRIDWAAPILFHDKSHRKAMG